MEGQERREERPNSRICESKRKEDRERGETTNGIVFYGPLVWTMGLCLLLMHMRDADENKIQLAKHSTIKNWEKSPQLLFVLCAILVEGDYDHCSASR